MLHHGASVFAWKPGPKQACHLSTLLTEHSPPGGAGSYPPTVCFCSQHYWPLRLIHSVDWSFFAYGNGRPVSEHHVPAATVRGPYFTSLYGPVPCTRDEGIPIGGRLVGTPYLPLSFSCHDDSIHAASQRSHHHQEARLICRTMLAALPTSSWGTGGVNPSGLETLTSGVWYCFRRNLLAAHWG